MLETVEDIEDAILKILIAHEDDLEKTHERVDIIIEQGEEMIVEVEKELDEKYADYIGDEKYDAAYLEEFKLEKQKILDAVKKSLDKEAEGVLLKIQSSDKEL